MKIAFSNLVDAAYSLPMSGKMELKKLLENNIVEERRNEMARDFKQSKEDLKNNKLVFSNDINELKNMLK